MTTRSKRHQRRLEWLDGLARKGLLPMHVYVELRHDPRLLDALRFFVEYWQRVYEADVDAHILERAFAEARAEAHAKESGWTTLWRQDYASWRELSATLSAVTPPEAVVAATLYNAAGEMIAANVGIIERGSAAYRASRRRHIEAELAGQAIREGRR